MENVSDINFQVAQSLLITKAFEYFLGCGCGFECVVIFTEQNERLNGRNERPSFFLGIAMFPEDLQRAAMEFQGFLIPPEHVKRVCFGTEAAGQHFGIVELESNGYSSFSE
ncbi:MAG TPA: hypothetical protein VFU57_04355 [Candidatus Acidoferrales bacterium]|nr:hypothetical protein [Candidatus Acidoferrales bacterium]